MIELIDAGFDLSATDVLFEEKLNEIIIYLNSQKRCSDCEHCQPSGDNGNKCMLAHREYCLDHSEWEERIPDNLSDEEIEMVLDEREEKRKRRNRR